MFLLGKKEIMDRKELNRAHKKGASTKHQITKNPRQYDIYSKQTNHPASISGTKVPQNNSDTSSKINQKES